ncbi:hypothetical protein [Tateyamaria sp. SN6-1]|uniref:hypothetical protein n=1 Tax=Tateyamaria sp. SN6-1 TaxID=3092148 RepID=UPI0039F63672
MNRFMITVAVAASVFAVADAQAQTVATTQASVEGASGVQTYSVRVVGANGQAYNCRPDIVTVDGTPTRLCRRATAGGSTTGGNALQGGTLGVGGAIGAGIIAIALVSGSDGTTTTTTGTP